MTEKINRRITAVILALLMTIGMMPAVTITAHADTAASISLVASDDFTFTAATEGYGTQAPYQVQVRSEGPDETGVLTVALGGSNPSAFTLSDTSFSSIASGGSSYFDVTPAPGLSEGTYTATVTVSGSNVASKSFNVSFTVSPAGTTYTATIRTYLDGSSADVTGAVELHKGSSVFTVSKTAVGIYEAAVPNDDYTIFINGISVGRHLIVSGANKSVTLDYFTVSFSASYGGTATGGSIGASVDSASINSGDRVLSGKTVTITATGTGSYTYLWSGAGTSGETTATLSVTLNNTVNAACAVTGSGTPPPAPDYEINGSGHNWTGSDETVALSGVSDTLNIYRAPTAVVKIEVQSADGSDVTIKGNSVACKDMRIVVSNDISLVLDDVNITAPLNWSALLLNSDGSAGTMTVNITGECSLTGTGYGCGIRSDHDQDFVITGNGILNATGGGNVSGTDGGSGIFSTASSKGTSLTIEGAVTINATGGTSLTHSGGGGIDIAAGSILINSGVVNATSGVSYGTSYNSSHGIGAFFSGSNHSIGGNIIIKGGTVKAAGGDAEKVSGGYGIYAQNKLGIEGGSVIAIGGNSVSGTGGAAALAYEQNLVVSGGSLTATGGKSESNYGGQAIYNFYKDILIYGGTVTAKGGQSTSKDGGRAIVAANLGLGNVLITGGNVTATGGSGGVNGAHAVYADKGTIAVSGGAILHAVGGTGTTGMGGVGLRAAGNDGATLHGNTVNVANSAGNVYIRGGQGATAQRASVMGKDIYIGTGNVGAIVMEGSNSRSIKNAVGGDDLYLVKAETNPAEEVEIQCAVNGTLSGSYTYRAVAAADGKACLWLPESAQTLSATGYEHSGLTVAASDTSNTAALSKPAVVTAHNSSELNTYMAAANVATINLVSGTMYAYDGAAVARELTINGNGAIINVGTGIDDTIIKKEGNTVTGKVFLAVQSGSLTIKNVTLRDVSTRILAAINVKTGGTLLLDSVTFEGFFANLSTDAYPSFSNIPGSYNNFGVHAEPGAVSTTVKNCTFGSSNTFRNAVAIRKGTAVIKDNTFLGTATPDRQNQTDGFEYAVYLYGGTCTVTGNDISGYDSILKPLGYHSAGISTCPYYGLTAAITGNKLYDNARGIDGVGAWHTYSDPADANINGTVLTSEGAFVIGQALKNANTFSGNTDGDIALTLDQNDNYIDTKTGIEYGPPVYFEPLLKLDSTNSTSATLRFDTGTWAQAMVRNAKSILIQVSEDNGTTWSTASTTGTIDSASKTVTVNLTAGKTYLLRSVITITANTRPVGSSDNVSADITSYSNTVSVTISSDVRTGHTGSPVPAAPGGVPVIVNGESKTAGTAQTVTDSDGKTTTTVTVDSGKLESILASKESGATVIIPVAGKPDTAAGVLTGEMVKGMENREATLVVKTDSATYMLPASEINITAISQQLGTNLALKDIKVEVSISAPSSQMSKAVESAAKEGGFTPVLSAVDYTVTCSYGGHTVNVSSFNAYVERTVAIPDGVDPSKITTGIVVNPDGTTHHVPTRVKVIDGKYYAVINSLTNSTYSVVWHPVVFSDVNSHWAKASVNNMGSRMVVEGVGSDIYAPDRDMTRAEFAAVMVRALGLEPGIGTGSFDDVASAKWYSGYVKTAAAYGIIKGYSDTAFGPNDKINREQAMTMIARAMKITGLNSGLTAGAGNALIAAFTDRAAVSSYAGDSIAECIKTGVVSGRGNNMLVPKAYVTRAEVAAMIERLLQKSNLI